MFNHIVNQQHLADSLKAAVHRDNHASGVTRRAANALIQAFERNQWQPRMFEEALAAVTPGEFEFDSAAERLNYRGAPNAQSAAIAVIRLIEAYRENLAPAEWVAVGSLDGIFDSRAAADYLGIGVDMLDTYVHRQNRLRGTLLGGVLLFAVEDLDDFKRTMKPRGRPRRTAETTE